jgi:hypothetical protein
MSASQRPGKNSPDTTRDDAPPDDHPTLQTFAETHGTTEEMARPIAIAKPEPNDRGFPTAHVAVDIPEQFIERYGHADTVAEALRCAEQAPTTGENTLGTCPRCYSTRLSVKTGYDSQQTHKAALVCTQCRAHLAVPGGAGSFRESAKPVDPRREIIPVEVGDAARYHVADGCTASGRTEKLTAAEVIDRGLEPCQHDACQPDAEWRACDQCGRPTFGAVEGIPLAVCADCVVVNDE